MAHQVMWKTVCVTDKDGNDTFVHRGADLPDWVDEFTLFALSTSGATQVVDREDTEPVAKAVQPVPLSESPDELTMPSADDPKAAWVAYASDERNPNRITHDQATGMTKSALMERFK